MIYQSKGNGRWRLDVIYEGQITTWGFSWTKKDAIHAMTPYLESQ